MIRRYKLYPDQRKAEKIAMKGARFHHKPKRRITQLVKEKKPYFLYRLRYLINEPTGNLETDNGNEFALEFERAANKLGIQKYFSSVRTSGAY